MKEKILTEEEAARKLECDLPENVGSKAPFVLTAEIDTTPQKLRQMRPYSRACAAVPGYLPEDAQLVLKLLFDCFTKQGSVSEGLIGDILWGFAQCNCVSTPKGLVPCPPELSYKGLCTLEKYGYIKFQAKDGSITSPQSDKIESAWVRYEQKLLDLVYE